MDESGVNMEKTIIMENRMMNNPFYEEPSAESKNGMYQGRHVIGRDTTILNGVYLGAGEREAIVVKEDEKYCELQDVYKELVEIRLLKEKQGIPFKRGILTDVFEITKKYLPPNESKVYEITKDLKADQKISLTSFIRNGGGVCRHQALLAGYLLEKLKNEGKISGKVSVDRNSIKGKGGHAWVRYTNSGGDIYIIDPAKNYIGLLNNISDQKWFYERPEDKKQDFQPNLKKLPISV